MLALVAERDALAERVRAAELTAINFQMMTLRLARRLPENDRVALQAVDLVDRIGSKDGILRTAEQALPAPSEKEADNA